jgi:type III restriction enzyme
LPTYPDFIFLREAEGKVVVDILEPHNPSLADAVAKAKGLARYADKHGARFGRIQIIAKLGDHLRRLEMTDPKVRKAINVAETAEAITHLYETMGT